jgi:hypothetical protein
MQMSPEDLERRKAAANPPKEYDDELLETGQEEVFSRTEVETGRTEHQDQAGKHAEPFSDEEPGPEQIRRDEEQTERQAPNDAGPGEAAS